MKHLRDYTAPGRLAGKNTIASVATQPRNQLILQVFSMRSSPGDLLRLRIRKNNNSVFHEAILNVKDKDDFADHIEAPAADAWETRGVTYTFPDADHAETWSGPDHGEQSTAGYGQTRLEVTPIDANGVGLRIQIGPTKPSGAEILLTPAQYTDFCAVVQNIAAGEVGFYPATDDGVPIHMDANGDTANIYE